MAERLRRWTANPLGSARAGSNPVVVDKSLYDYIYIYIYIYYYELNNLEGYKTATEFI